MKRTDLAYLAGIFDGEGSISLRRYKGKRIKNGIKLDICVVNTNEWLIQWLKFSFGGYVSLMQHNKLGKMPCYQWSKTSIQAREFLELIYPYLRLKKTQAEIAINFQKQKEGRHFRERTSANIAVEEAQRILIMKMHGRNTAKEGI